MKDQLEKRAPARTFQDLIVWQKAHQLTLNIYKETADFPKEEVYGLTSQVRRSAISIAANIAEGFRKKSNADKGRFLNIAQGSLEETRYYLILANDLNYSNTSVNLNLLEEVSKMLNAYRRTILKTEYSHTEN